jgi:luciferase family oxidoreductase group 1
LAGQRGITRSDPGTEYSAPVHGPRLSVLDTLMIGHSAEESVSDTIELARQAERLGYARYWMAEHHGVPAVGSSAPVIPIGAIAAATTRIHAGSGGVMLPNHVPLVVAEQFGTLAALYPAGRPRGRTGIAQSADGGGPRPVPLRLRR